MMVSILGALGGLVMTLPRLYYAAASQYDATTAGSAWNPFFRALSWISPSSVPAGAVLFSAALSIAALLFFSTFRRIVTFFVVPLHFVNILMVAAVFRLRRRLRRDVRLPHPRLSLGARGVHPGTLPFPVERRRL